MNNPFSYTQDELITVYITCRFIEYTLYTEHRELQARTEKIRNSIISFLSVESCEYLLQFGEDLHNMKVERIEKELFSKDNNSKDSNKSILSSKPSKSLEGYTSKGIDTNWSNYKVSLPLKITSSVISVTVGYLATNSYVLTIESDVNVTYKYNTTLKDALFQATLIVLCAISYKNER